MRNAGLWLCSLSPCPAAQSRGWTELAVSMHLVKAVEMSTTIKQSKHRNVLKLNKNTLRLTNFRPVLIILKKSFYTLIGKKKAAAYTPLFLCVNNSCKAKTTHMIGKHQAAPATSSCAWKVHFPHAICLLRQNRLIAAARHFGRVLVLHFSALQIMLLTHTSTGKGHHRLSQYSLRGCNLNPYITKRPKGCLNKE